MPEPETLTQPPPLAPGSPTDPPPEGLTPTPAPASAPEAQPKPEGEVTPEGADTGGAPEPPAWAKAESLDALFAHEEVLPGLNQRLDTARVEAQEEGRKDAQRRMQPLLNQQHEQLQAIDGKVNQFVTSWNKLVRASPDKGGLERADVENLLEDHRDTFAALSGQHQELGKWAGANGLIHEIGQAIKSNELTTEFQGRLSQLQRGLSDATLFEDLAKAIASEVTKPLKAELEEAKATVTRLETEARTADRNGQRPPAEPAGAPGKGSDTSVAARLDRLAYGRDAAGNPPTQEDREWIAARGN